MAKLGELAVYLTANTDNWSKNISRAQKDISSLAKTASAGFAIASASVAAFATKSLMAYAEQERAVKGLDAALLATGQNSAGTSARIQSFAMEMQRLTEFGDEAVMSVMGIGIQMGISSSQIEQATRAAIGLTSRGMDLNSAMLLIGKAAAGNFQTLARLGISLTEGATKEEKFAELLAKGSSEFEIAMAKTDSLSGRFAQLKNITGDMFEEFGHGIEKIFGVKGGMEALRDSIGGATSGIRAYFDGLDETTLGTYKSLGLLAAGLAALPPAYYAATVAAKAFAAAGLGVHVVGGGVIMLAKYVFGLYSTAAVLAQVTGTTTLAAAAQLGYNAALSAAIPVMSLLGGAAAAVGVAFVGWQIGKHIAELTGLDKKIVELAGRWNMFGQKEAEARGAMAEAESKRLSDIMKRRRAGEIIPEQETAARQERKTETIDDKELKAKEKYEKTLADYRFDQMSDQQKLNQLLMEQSKLQSEINASTGAKKFELQEQFIKRQESIDRLSAKRAEDEKSSVDRLAKARESEFDSRLTDEQKLFEAEEKRKHLLVEVEEARQRGDVAAAREKLAEAFDVTRQIGQLADKEPDKIQQETRLTSAMEKGSVEAYSAIAKAGDRIQDRIADNTKRTAEAAEKQAQTLKEIEDSLNREFPIG